MQSCNQNRADEPHKGNKKYFTNAHITVSAGICIHLLVLTQPNPQWLETNARAVWSFGSQTEDWDDACIEKIEEIMPDMHSHTNLELLVLNS